MAYSAFETSAGEAMNVIEGYCKQYTSSNVFSTSTQPTLTEVETFLTMRYYTIQAILGDAGYELIPTDAEVLGYLQHLNSVGAVLDIELTNPITGTGEPNERYKVFEKMWENGVKFIQGSGLEQLGATREGQSILAGGISISRKEVLGDDTDAVPPKFRRGMQEHPGLPDTPKELREYSQ